jgi:hypothetical protein
LPSSPLLHFSPKDSYAVVLEVLILTCNSQANHRKEKKARKEKQAEEAKAAKEKKAAKEQKKKQTEEETAAAIAERQRRFLAG